jgi:hypothetical protein
MGPTIQRLLCTALILAPAAAAAQSGKNAEVKVDCSLFSKKPNGTWFLSRQTTIEMGSSQINLPVGDIEPRMFQFGMADLSTVLDTACSDKAGEPSQSPKSETETAR